MALLTALRRKPQPLAPKRPSAIFPAPTLSQKRGVANTVSAVLSPPVLGTTMIAIAAIATQQVAPWTWACTALILNVLAPIGYLLWLLKQGLVSDLDVQNRTERARPLSFTLAAMSITVLVLRLLNAPPLLLAVSAAQLVQTALALVITLRWKISMHSAACAACLALVVFVMGRQAAPVLLALPLVGWSRVYLGRHTPAQTIAGAALGGLITWGTLTWSALS